MSSFYTAACYAQPVDSIQKLIALQIAPLYTQMKTELLPANYRKKGEIIVMLDISVDTAGVPWFALEDANDTLWSPAKYWQYILENDQTKEDLIKGISIADLDRQRRLKILIKHREWPRRIIRAVRQGQICLDMSSEQLIAAWDKPIQKSSAFTLGLGKHTVWFYKDTKGALTTVMLKNDVIIGWSTQ